MSIGIPSKRLWQVVLESTWAMPFIIAGLTTPVVLSLEKQVPGLIIVPLLFAGIGLGILDIIRSGKDYDEDWDAPKEFTLFSNYEEIIALEVKPQKKRTPKEQLPLPFGNFPEMKAESSLRYLEDKATEKKVAVISCEKFNAMLLSYLLEHADKGAELALLKGLNRFAHTASVANEIKEFIDDKGVREVIISELRGHIAMSITKGGDKILRELAKAIQKEERKWQEEEKKKSVSRGQPEDFRLDPPE